MVNRLLTTFEDAEFQADWDEAKERLGTQPCPEQLERSASQRRADALVALARRAASTPADARSPEPLVNIIMTRQAFPGATIAFVRDSAHGRPGTSTTGARACR